MGTLEAKKASELETLVVEFKITHPTKDELKKAYARAPNRIKINEHFAEQYLKSAYTELKIKKLQKKHPDKVRLITFNEDVYKSINYLFEKRKNGAIDVIDIEDYVIGKIGHLVAFADIPIMINTRLGRYNQSRGGLKVALKERNIDRWLNILEQLTDDSNARMMFIVPKNQMLGCEDSESNMFKFIEKGGIIIPFYTDLFGWKKDVVDIIYSARQN